MGYKMIYATDSVGCIGKNNSLPFKSKKDMEWFKKVTTNETIIMGRKTWDSLPKKPLPNRKHIIITRNKDFKVDDENVKVVNSIMECFNLSNTGIVIGGSEIYSMFEQFCDIAYVTLFPEIKVEEGDTFFNLSNEWKVIYSEEEYENSTKINFKILQRY